MGNIQTSAALCLRCGTDDSAGLLRLPRCAYSSHTFSLMPGGESNLPDCLVPAIQSPDVPLCYSCPQEEIISASYQCRCFAGASRPSPAASTCLGVPSSVLSVASGLLLPLFPRVSIFSCPTSLLCPTRSPYMANRSHTQHYSFLLSLLDP